MLQFNGKEVSCALKRYWVRESPVREVCALKGILVGNVVLQNLICVCWQ